MLNILFTLSENQPLTEAQKAQFIAAGCVWVDEIPEMPRQGQIIPIQAYVPSVEILSGLKAQLDLIDTRGSVEIIGVWNDDGTAYDTENFQFNAPLYSAYLRPVADSNGGWRQPTVEEAVLIQVNRFAGMPDRVLS